MRRNAVIKTLVIGDAHADPYHENSRFTALGNFIALNRPTNIVQIGDWGSYDSINFHDRGNVRIREGKRLIDDYRAAQDAYHKMMNPIREENIRLRNNKKAPYKFNGFWFESNHEDRIKRYIDENPVLEGFIPENDLVGASWDGWNIVPWKQCTYINGICFTHIPLHEGNNQPISGKYIARKAADLHQNTVVFGHTHRFIVEPLARAGSNGRIYNEGINVGWYGDYTPDYIVGHMGTSHWWAGLVILHHIEEGRVDIERIDITEIKRQYS